MKLTEMSDEELITHLMSLRGHECRLLAEQLLVLVEVEDRRLELRSAYASMFDFCVRQLRLSDGSAGRRVAAARLVRRYPQLVPLIEGNHLSLSNLHAVARLVTDDNFDDVIASIRGKSKRDVERVVARLAPQREARASVRGTAARAASPAELVVASDVPAAAVPVPVAGASPTESIAPTLGLLGSADLGAQAPARLLPRRRARPVDRRRARASRNARRHGIDCR